MNRKLTLDEHKMNADDLAVAFHHLLKVFDRCNENYPKSGKLMKSLSKVDPASINGRFTEILSLLDEDFHSIISDDEFNELGHIYYNLGERYENMKESCLVIKQ
jgi:hypothetical protein